MEPAQPSKADIESVFSRLRTIAANKVCFDCSAKNPTWSSVTYGVFICIDCSAVHRSLGVHLTFVRSTQLDTNWTWVQLRQMQLGGNSNATQFFTRHNCVTTDAQKKYNSRAAQLYRDKLQQLAINNLKTNNQLHIHPHVEEPVEEKEADFFADHENFATPDGPQPPPTKEIEKGQSLQQTSEDPEEGPTVNFSLSAPVTPNENNARKSTISARKPTNKKPGLGTKKGSLGATRVKTNFAELEREAEITEENRLRSLEESARAAAAAQKAQEEREAAVRLAYKDLSTEQTKKEEQIRRQDPKKAEQVERLGMGVGARTGISHSAVSDMQVIEQENVKSSTGRSTINDLRRMKLSDNQNDTGGAASSSSFFDDFSSFDSGFSMNRNTSGGGGGGGGMTFSKIDSLMSESSNNNNNNNSNNVTSYGSKNSDDARDRDYNSRKERDNNSSWVIVEDPMEKPKRSSASRNVSDRNAATTDAAQKKFGNAKAISSDQYFNDREADYETKANLNRFQGSSSISSAEFFGNGKDNVHPNSLQAYDLDDVKESVRQGVTKVAGKISSLANGVMSSLQDRYGY